MSDNTDEQVVTTSESDKDINILLTSVQQMVSCFNILIIFSNNLI